TSAATPTQPSLEGEGFNSLAGLPNEESYAKAEKIGRLGIPALAQLRGQGPVGCQGAPVRPGRVQRDRRPARAQGSAQPRALAFLRGPCRRIQQELELLCR